MYFNLYKLFQRKKRNCHLRLTHVKLGNPTPSLDTAMTAATTASMDLVEGRIYVVRTSLPVEKQIASAEQNGAVAVVVISPTYCTCALQ